MTVYNQRIKFSIILGVLFFSIVCVIWYNNNISSRLNYVEKRISYLDDQITKGSTLPIKIENAFSKCNQTHKFNSINIQGEEGLDTLNKPSNCLEIIPLEEEELSSRFVCPDPDRQKRKLYKK